MVVRLRDVVGGLSLTLMVAACGGAERRPERQPPLVSAAPTKAHLFVDRIEAVGTARANEQVTLSSPVTERIADLRFDDGNQVARGQILVVLDQGQEQAALAGAQAAERQAEAQLTRVRSLSERGFATGALLDQQLAAAQTARASADNARAQIADRVLRAPFSGLVSLRNISEGAIVNAGTPIATVSDLSRIKLDFSVPEGMLPSLRVGQPIQAMAAAYPDQPFRGVISTIDPVIDPVTRAVLVRAVLPNPGYRVKPGMLMTVRVESASRMAQAVPELAVIGEGAERFVYVVGPGNKATRARVEVGSRDSGLIEVRGLKPGQRVIGEGVVKVAEGTRVRVQGDKAPTERAERPGVGVKRAAGA